MRRLIVLLMVLLAVINAAAAQEGEDEESLNSTYHYTYHQPTGNRLIGGIGAFPNVQSQSLPLEGTPLWVVGAAFALEGVENPLWAVLLEGGDVQGTFIGLDGQLSISPVLPGILAPEMPLVLTVNEIGAFPEQILPPVLSPLSHPVFTATRTVYITDAGEAVMLLNEAGEELVQLPLGPLPDGRIAINTPQTQAALYVGATADRYEHGVLGDPLEAAALMVMTLEDGNVPVIIDPGADAVFEGTMPLWADVNADGTEDVVTTVSSAANGAQIRVYNAVDGALLAQGPAIGTGQRWRHQLAWGAFGPNGENELVEVLTPHIGGVVGFYRYDGAGGLEIVASLPGYTSHVINSRNLDMAVGGDFDGDGQPEIVLPDQERGRIAGLRHAGEGDVVEAWSLPLEGVLVTNLAAVQLADGRMALAAGVQTDAGNLLQVWLP